MIRELVNKFNRSLAERMVATRKKFQVPIKITFKPEVNTVLSSSQTDGLFITGETVDMSKTGIGFLVPSIRIREFYLVGQDRVLNIELDLPTGKVRMQMVGKRYERVGIHSSAEKFLIGAHITSISPDDRQAYEYFLRHGNKLRSGAALELGID